LTPFFWPYEELISGRLIKRYKRFLADVELADGSIVTAHSGNTGSMLGCSTPGSQVYLSRSNNPARKLSFSWEAIRVGRVWVSINTLLPNRLLNAAIAEGCLDRQLGLSGERVVQPEVRVGGAGSTSNGQPSSRLDLHVQSETSSCYIEIKNVTLVDASVARFPDAETVRGQKHLRELMALARSGQRAVLVFFVARADADAMGPADDIDAEYGRLLRAAHRVGVTILACRARVTKRGVTLEKTLPILLD
jgi:sugar fermentation stimulation protein A